MEILSIGAQEKTNKNKLLLHKSHKHSGFQRDISAGSHKSRRHVISKQIPVDAYVISH